MFLAPKIFPEDFVGKILEKNINKLDPVKETRKQLREIFLMYKNLNRKEELKEIWEFVKEEVEVKGKKILDLGCGKDYEFFKNEQVDYTGVDVVIDENIITDDILNPKEDWKDKEYDVILMFNVIPVIEKLEKGSGERLLERLKERTKFIVLSFPFFSLSGRKYIGHFWKKYINELKKKWKVVGESEDREAIIILKGESKDI